MTALPTVSPAWLRLRAAADDRARSASLARDAAGLLPVGPQVIHDLGSGSGAMMAWLAPRLPNPQRWVRHDADPAILEHGDRTDVVDGSGRPVTSRASVEELADLRAADLAGATLVVASALLDVITLDEARAVVAACVERGVPVLFSLTVTGRVEFGTPDDSDRRLESAFNEHQRRTADGRRLLGPDASVVVGGLLRDAGWTVRTAATPWELDADDSDLITEWLDGWVGAAVEQVPELRESAGEYRARRVAQLRDGLLRVAVHHRDVLAWPA